MLGAFALASGSSAALAQAPTITPITWNIIGLDSNNVNAGPDVFPVGVRVCSTGASLNGYMTRFVWESANANISLSSAAEISLPAVAPNACQDVFHEVTVSRVAAARSTGRRYRIELLDAGGSVQGSTPANREIYVRPLISQNRNSTLQVSVDGNPVAIGGSIPLVRGQSYTIRLDAKTATQGYEQLENFLTLPAGVFRVNSVVSTYTANAGTDPSALSKVYADGCGWVNDVTSPDYQSCSGRGKYGGTTSVTYQVTAIGVGSGAIRALIYDFSGNSFHYNSDYDGTSFNFTVSEPPPVVLADLSVSKSDGTPNVTPGGTTSYTLVVANNGPSEVSGASVTDIQPADVTFTGWACTVTSPGSGGTVTTACPSLPGSGSLNVLVNMKAGAVLTFVGSASISNSVSPPTTISNTAAVAVPPGVTDPNTANNSSTDINQLAPVADLSIAKVLVTPAPAVGDSVTFTVTVTNSGPSAVSGATISDVLPNGFDLSPAPTVACAVTQAGTGATTACTSQSFSGATMSAVATLGVGGQVRYTIVAKINGTGSNWLNTATVAPPAGVVDPTLGNNSASASAEPSILTITKTASQPTYTVGQTPSFTVRVSKQGNTDGLGLITVTDSPLPGLVVTGMTGSGWNCSVSSGIGTCTRTDVNGFSGFYPDITVTAAFSGNAALPANFTNVVFVSDDGARRFAEATRQVTLGAQPIPTASFWGLLALAVLLSAFGAGRFRARG